MFKKFFSKGLLSLIETGGLIGLVTKRALAVEDVNIGELEQKYSDATGFRFNSVNLGRVISDTLPYIFMLAGVGVLFYLIYGGYHLMVSQGDEKAMAEARGKITNAVIGFVVIFLSYWIMQILGVILGLDRFGGLF